MRSALVASMVAALAVAMASGAATAPAGTFLTTTFHLSAADLDRLDRDQVITRTLDVKNRREIATLGIVRIRTSPSVYVERLADIASFKRAADVLQVGRFSNPPQLRDLAALTLDDGDLKRLRECKVDDCDVRFGAEAIERIRQEIDWRAADVMPRASGLVRQLLLSYVARYQSGDAAAMEYADRRPRRNVADEFASLLDADTLLTQHAPGLRRHLLDYPSSAGERITDFVYWSKELVRGRPVISMTHVATAAIADSPIAYAAASKQIYAMHYYDASLGLTLLLPDGAAGAAATYVVYLNRSRIDLFEGTFGGIARRIVAGKARGVVEEQLQRLQRTLAAPSPQDSSSRR